MSVKCAFTSILRINGITRTSVYTCVYMGMCECLYVCMLNIEISMDRGMNTKTNTNTTMNVNMKLHMHMKIKMQIQMNMNLHMNMNMNIRNPQGCDIVTDCAGTWTLGVKKSLIDHKS